MNHVTCSDYQYSRTELLQYQLCVIHIYIGSLETGCVGIKLTPVYSNQSVSAAKDQLLVSGHVVWASFWSRGPAFGNVVGRLFSSKICHLHFILHGFGYL